MSTSPRWTWRTCPCAAMRAICSDVNIGNAWSTREASVNGTGGVVSGMSSLRCAANRYKEGSSQRMYTMSKSLLTEYVSSPCDAGEQIRVHLVLVHRAQAVRCALVDLGECLTPTNARFLPAVPARERRWRDGPPP